MIYSWGARVLIMCLIGPHSRSNILQSNWIGATNSKMYSIVFSSLLEDSVRSKIMTR